MWRSRDNEGTRRGKQEHGGQGKFTVPACPLLALLVLPGSFYCSNISQLCPCLPLLISAYPCLPALLDLSGIICIKPVLLAINYYYFKPILVWTSLPSPRPKKNWTGLLLFLHLPPLFGTGSSKNSVANDVSV